MTALIAGLIAGGVGLGVWLLLAGVRGVTILPSLRGPSDTGARLGVLGGRLGVGAVVGAVVFLLTGWPSAGVLVAVAAMAAPTVRGGAQDRRRQLERIEAVASFIEMVRDNMAGAAGMEQALMAASDPDIAPVAIAPALRRFGNRLHHSNLVDSLAALGDDLDDPSADLAMVALSNAARMEARDLGPLLSRLAMSIRDDVRRREQIEVGRQRIRTSARIVVVVTALTMVILLVFGQGILEAYDTVAGQLWLLVVGGVFVLGGVLLRHYGKIESPDRFRARRTSTGAVR